MNFKIKYLQSTSVKQGTRHRKSNTTKQYNQIANVYISFIIKMNQLSTKDTKSYLPNQFAICWCLWQCWTDLLLFYIHNNINMYMHIPDGIE